MDIIMQMQLAQEKMVQDVLNKIMDVGVYGNIQSYEEKNSMKLYFAFKRLNKNSYGNLMNFAYWVTNCEKYYTSEKSIKLSKEVFGIIRKFMDDYEPLLI